MRAVPVVFMTYDVLEDQNQDIRALPLARAARSAGRAAQGIAVATVADRDGRDVGRAGGAPRRFAGARRRRPHAQAADVGLRRRPQARRLVEVEDRAVLHRRRADLRPAGQRQARQPADRLHVRRLGQGRARADCQGVFRVCRTRRSTRWIAGSAATRASASARCGTSSRRTSSSWASKASRGPRGTIGHRRPVPADAALAPRQEAGRCGHHRIGPRPARGSGIQLAWSNFSTAAMIVFTAPAKNGC